MRIEDCKLLPYGPWMRADSEPAKEWRSNFNLDFRTTTPTDRPAQLSVPSHVMTLNTGVSHPISGNPLAVLVDGIQADKEDHLSKKILGKLLNVQEVDGLIDGNKELDMNMEVVSRMETLATQTIFVDDNMKANIVNSLLNGLSKSNLAQQQVGSHPMWGLKPR